MKKDKSWIEIRRGPLQGTASGRSFTVALVTDPRGPAEPYDPQNRKRGARGYTNSESFEEACKLAATYAINYDRTYINARLKFEALKKETLARLVEEFREAGEPE